MIEIKTFVGGLNSDLEDRVLPESDYRYAINIRNGVNDTSSTGSIENVKGNTLVEFDLPDDENRCIGTFEDEVRSHVYFYVWNKFGEHTIQRFDTTQNTVTKVLQSSVLAFEEDMLIIDSDRIENNLYFNDRVNEPRKINLSTIADEVLVKDFVFNSASKSNVGTIAVTSVVGNANQYNVGDVVKVFLSKPSEETDNFDGNAVIVAIPSDFSLELSITFLPINSFNQANQYYGYIYHYRDIIETDIINSAIPPLKSPKVNYVSDEEFKTNNLYGSTWQFRYQYVYDDNSKSYWSYDSKRPVKIFTETQALVNQSNYFSYNENAIQVSFNTGNCNVKSINLSVRQNNGDYKLIRAFDKDYYNLPDNSEYIFDFYNTDVLTAIDVRESDRVNEFLPLRANTQDEFNNRIGYGGVLEGYDTPFVNASVDYKYGNEDRVELLDDFEKFQTDSFSYPDTGFNFTRESFEDSDTGFYNTVFSGVIPVNSLGVNDSSLFFNFSSIFLETPDIESSFVIRVNNIAIGYQFKYDGGIQHYTLAPESFVLSVSADDTLQDVADNLNALVGDLSFSVFTGGSITLFREDIVIRSNFFVVGSDIGYTLSIDNSFQAINDQMGDPQSVFVNRYFNYANKPTGDVKRIGIKVEAYSSTNEVSLKRGAYHAFSVLYKDELGRVGSVQNPENMRAIVNWYDVVDNNSKVYPIIKIRSKAPSWAKYYDILYNGNNSITKNLIDGFSGFLQAEIKFVIDNVSIYSNVNLSSVFDYAINNGFSKLFYSFQEGDRIRLIRDDVGTYLTDYKDYSILSFNEDTKVLKVRTNEDSFNLDQKIYLAEIYRPKKFEEDDEKLYYTVGESYEIDSEGNHLSGNHIDDVNQDISLDIPLSLNLNNVGDVFIKERSLVFNEPSIVVEDYHSEDAYFSAYTDFGRGFAYNADAKQQFNEATVRFSEEYISNTFINGASSFFGDGFRDYDRRYGAIQKMYSEDNRMIIFQKLKTGFSLIGENILYNSDGVSTVQVNVENLVLSKINYYAGEYGIGDAPESFAVHGFNKYHVDTNKRKVLRLGQSGYEVISDAAMKVYWSDTTPKYTRFLGTYDIRHDEYILCMSSPLFKGLGGDAEEPTTIAWSEPKKRWVTFYSYYPEMIGQAGDGLVSYSSGKIYTHNTNESYNTFYDKVNYDKAIFTPSRVTIVSNNDPKSIKFYVGIYQDTNSVWDMPEATNQFGQKTSLIKADFEELEGTYYSPFLMDENSGVELPLLEGDPMRCHTMTLTLENDSTDYVRMFSTTIRNELSQFTNQ